MRERTAEVSSIHLAYLSILIKLSIDNLEQVKGVQVFLCTRSAPGEGAAILLHSQTRLIYFILKASLVDTLTH